MNSRISPSALRPSIALAALLLVALASGCATYSNNTAKAREMARTGNYDQAIEQLNSLLKVKDGKTLPDPFRKNDALVLLERGMLHQARADYAASQVDLQAADKELELLDFTGDVAGSIGKYIYSDSAGLYKISPTERLSLNSINVLNYLANKDLRGARVEVRRFTTMRNFLKEYQPNSAHGAIGSYVSGFVMEKLGEGNSAMRYYDEALEGRDLATLYGPISELSKSVSYRGSNVTDFLSRGANRYHSVPTNPEQGEILVVVAIGRVPYKMPKRIPIGAAVGIAGAYVTGDLKILERSALKVVVYPELVPAEGIYSTASVHVDGKRVLMEQVTDLGADITKEYEAVKARIIAAAVSRMIARALVAEGARKAGQKASPGVGVLAAVVAEGALLVADKPDTRSWTLLPGRFFAARIRVDPGDHRVRIGLGTGDHTWRSTNVTVPKGGFAVIVATPLH